MKDRAFRAHFSDPNGIVAYLVLNGTDPASWLCTLRSSVSLSLSLTLRLPVSLSVGRSLPSISLLLSIFVRYSCYFEYRALYPSSSRVRALSFSVLRPLTFSHWLRRWRRRRRRDTLEKFQFIPKVVMTESTNTFTRSRS